MGKSCCIEGCMVAREDIEYFTFPVAKKLRAAWLAVCGRAGDAVCAAHFTEDDYKNTRGTRRLRAAAVPSVALNKKPPTITENESKKTTGNIDTNKEDEKKKEIQEKSTEDTADTSTEVKPAETSVKETASVEACVKTTETVDVDTRQAAVCVKENGQNEGSAESIQTEEKDIEEMITNYQIKQTKTLADRLNPEPLEDLIPSIMSDVSSKLSSDYTGQLNRQAVSQLAKKLESQLASRLASQLGNQLDDQLGEVVEVEPDVVDAAPVFIEVAIEKDARSDSRAASPRDCVMLLESVQCDVDPSSLMLPEHGPDTDSDMEIIDVKKEDLAPISLLTSSDEDEVIIEEPHIDTVELSSETDEDDRPLTRLIKKKKSAQKPKSKKKYLLGTYDFYCGQCNYRTADESEFKRHNLELEHSTAIQICPSCNYTTASKAQFSRHKRKHKDERNFKCHLCNYKARHNMSLMYHLKSHNVPNAPKTPIFSCVKCGFSSNVKSEGLSHIKNCSEGRYLCGLCSYSTKRRSDLKRHRMRKHSVDENDQDFTL